MPHHVLWTSLALGLACGLSLGCVSGSDSGRATDGGAAGETTTETGENDAAPIFPAEDGGVDDTATSETSGDASTGPADTTPSVADTTPAAVDTATCSAAIGASCCPGSVCAAGAYCVLGTCHAMPTSIEEGSDPGRCSDLGVTHVAPAFFARFTVTGRANAVAHRMFRRPSCTGSVAAEAPGSPFNLGATGTYSSTLENTATTVCENGNLGRYEVWFVVDGQETTHQFTAVFNSTCLAYATCASVTNVCP